MVRIVGSGIRTPGIEFWLHQFIYLFVPWFHLLSGDDELLPHVRCLALCWLAVRAPTASFCSERHLNGTGLCDGSGRGSQGLTAPSFSCSFFFLHPRSGMGEAEPWLSKVLWLKDVRRGCHGWVGGALCCAAACPPAQRLTWRSLR